jgi:uncharacterized protein DUF6152
MRGERPQSRRLGRQDRLPVKAAVATFALASAALAMPAFAHHSLSGQFDVDKSVHIKGVVSKVEWVNPHCYVYVDETQADGSTATWRLESLPVAMMRKAGLDKKELMGGGKPVEIDAHPARNGTPHLGYMLHIKFADGRFVAFSKVPGEQPPP